MIDQQHEPTRVITGRGGPHQSDHLAIPWDRPGYNSLSYPHCFFLPHRELVEDVFQVLLVLSMDPRTFLGNVARHDKRTCENGRSHDVGCYPHEPVAQQLAGSIEQLHLRFCAFDAGRKL